MGYNDDTNAIGTGLHAGKAGMTRIGRIYTDSCSVSNRADEKKRVYLFNPCPILRQKDVSLPASFSATVVACLSGRQVFTNSKIVNENLFYIFCNLIVC